MRLSVLLAILPFALGAPAAERSDLAPIIRAKGKVVADKYIVKLKEGSHLAALDDTISKIAGGAHARYEHLFKGFAGTIDAKTLETLRAHPDVSHCPSVCRCDHCF